MDLQPVKLWLARLWKAAITISPSSAFVTAALTVALLAALVFHDVPRSAARSRPEPTPLTLHVETAADGLRVTWNSALATVKQADHGILTVTEGGVQKQLLLTGKELNGGAVVYPARAQDVSFRLDLFTTGHSVSAGVRMVQGPEAGTPAATPSNLTTPAEPATERPAEPVPTSAQAASERRPSPFINIPATPRARQEIADVAPPSLSPNGSLAAASAPVQPNLPAAAYLVSTTVEPAPAPFMRRAIEHVPGLRLLQRRRYKAGDRFTPAYVVSKPLPSVPAALRRNLTGVVPVDFRVSLDRAGDIAEVSLLSEKTDRQFVALAEKALDAWRFEPAQLNNRKVDSEVLVHFRFGEAGTAR